MSYYDHYPNLSRRPSFHGSVHGDYHHSSYDDTYGARQPFGEVNNRYPSSVRPKLGGPDGHIPRQPYQQFPGQAPFPGYNPPLAHQQQFPISREPQSSDFYPPDGNPHSFVASPPEPVHAVPSVSRRPSWNAGVDPRARRRDHQPNRSFSGMPTSEYPPLGPAHNPQRVSPPAHIPPPSQMHPMPSSPDFPPPPGPPYMSRTASRHDTEYPHMQHPGSRPIPGPGPPPHTIRRVKSLSGRDFPHSHDEILGGGFGSGAHGLDAPHSFRPPPAYADSYEDSPLTEPAYFEGVERGRTLSTGYHNGPVMAPPLASYPSKLYRSRSRRASTPGPYTAVPVPMAPMSAMEPYTQRTGASIMFKLKGGYSEGISLSDAMADARLSRSCQYSFHQLHLGLRGRLTMRVRWNGYRSLNYEIPVTGYDGLVNMQSFARRLARGVVHYLQTNGITIPWDRVVLHRLDEETHGLWVPVLTTI